MPSKQLILILLVALTFFSCKVFQYAPVSDEEKQSKLNAQSNIERKDKSGKCYARAQPKNSYETYFKDYAIYTGNESEETVDLEYVELIIKPASTKWVKKKADINCISENQDDCLVWCLVEIPPETEAFTILIDTTQSKNYEVKSLRYEELSEQGDIVINVWTAVLCKSDITVDVITQIQSALVAEEYLTAQTEATFNDQTKEALAEFQRDNNLAVGQLDFETLSILGVQIK